MFGLGLPEVLVVMTAAAVLYGPAYLRKKSSADSARKDGRPQVEGWRLERLQRIDAMLESAAAVRNERAWQRILQAVEDDDKEVIQRIDSFKKRSTNYGN